MVGARWSVGIMEEDSIITWIGISMVRGLVIGTDVDVCGLMGVVVVVVLVVVLMVVVLMVSLR
jgi:hypothetical protein